MLLKRENSIYMTVSPVPAMKQKSPCRFYFSMGKNKHFPKLFKLRRHGSCFILIMRIKA